MSFNSKEGTLFLQPLGRLWSCSGLLACVSPSAPIERRRFHAEARLDHVVRATLIGSLAASPRFANHGESFLTKGLAQFQPQDVLGSATGEVPHRRETNEVDPVGLQRDTRADRDRLEDFYLDP